MTEAFEVGKVYSNRIGSYEVVQINRTSGRMVIRYLETGDAQEVDLALQARIWSNMQLEEQLRTRESTEQTSRDQRGYGSGFTGLQSGDFKTSTEGTTWRRRSGFAGYVARLTSEGTPYTFISWSIYRWPVALITHREDYSMVTSELGSRKAKFTLELDYAHLYYGLYVEKGPQQLGNEWDWPRLIRALETREDLRSLISRAEKDMGIQFIGRLSKGTRNFHFANGVQFGAQLLWDEDSLSSPTVDERLDLLRSIPEDHWGELYLISTIPKQKTLDAGLDVARPIARAFKMLLPIYEAAVGYPSDTGRL